MLHFVTDPAVIYSNECWRVDS